ncbi:hypothetical protein HN865_00245 [Candidatus Woesearchaeota archaeon]|jgi:hypothetical protein|nr:hypothetical protein [Candidatus Woesearchaeota archaeon]MBT7237271.1 hypothetical protein [Candidatus Woesearchaeota archaeon]
MVELIHMYAFKYTSSNSREVILYPETSFHYCSEELQNLEGLIFTKTKIEKDDLRFSIIQKREILSKYDGIIRPFQRN